ncbi:MAG: hypothetical protein QOK05_977 [Chloroflexota bacterium]|jgi:YVTN family beta-propeller protein|nr:hypothetical protein [Chloroflexota bacterium]
MKGSALFRRGVIAALLLGTAVLTSAPKDGAAPRVVSPTSQTSQDINGVSLLPNGRLVTPAGSVYNVGEHPWGLALSPDGRLAVTNNSGHGFGLNVGSGTYCEKAGQTTTCPYLSPQQQAHVGNYAETTYDESLSVVNLGSGTVTDVKAHPTGTDPTKVHADGTFNYFFMGVAFSPDGQHLYASGGGNDAVYEFGVAGGVVQSPPTHTLIVPDQFVDPSASGSLSPDYPVFGTVHGFTKSIAVTPDGAWLLVSHEFNNTLDIIRASDMTLSQQVVLASVDPLPFGGFSPYGVVVSPDGRTAYVAGQGLGKVGVVTLDGNGHGVLTGIVDVGYHPTALAMSPDGSQLYVANTDDDTVDVVDTTTHLVAAVIPVHVLDGEALGAGPTSISVAPDGQRLYVALSGDDAVAVLGVAASFNPTGPGPAAPANPTPSSAGSGGLPNTAPAPPPAPSAWTVGGFIPTGWYPGAVGVSASGDRLMVASAKGVGSRYIPPFTSGGQRRGDIRNTYEYDANNMPGVFQVIAPPDAAQLQAMTVRVRQNFLNAAAADSLRSLHNPIPATIGGHTPITHVIEIVRENRTFDEVLGDLGVDTGRDAAQVDAMASNVFVGRDTTPNGHAIAGDVAPGVAATQAFATSDNFYSDGEASIQGHWWTAAANTIDYVEKSYIQNYSNRNRVYEPESTISQPKNCTLFQSAALKQVATAGAFSFRNYGELIGLTNINIPGLNLGYIGSPTAPNPCSAIPGAAVDPNAALWEQNLDQDGRSQATEFLADSGMNLDGTPNGKAGATLRNFSYAVIGGDHTGGLGWAETPRARIAENDMGVGMIVSALSRSSYWDSTAIFVMEDDSQDGLDHQDGHRNVLYVISPYAKHVGPDGKAGYIGHRHYSQVSVLKSIEHILGIPYLSSYDQNASPLYDLFQDKDTPAALTDADKAPFTVQPKPFFVPEPSSCYDANPANHPANCPPPSVSPAVAAQLMERSQGLNVTKMDAATKSINAIAWILAHPERPVPDQFATGPAAGEP